LGRRTRQSSCRKPGPWGVGERGAGSGGSIMDPTPTAVLPTVSGRRESHPPALAESGKGRREAPPTEALFLRGPARVVENVGESWRSGRVGAALKESASSPLYVQPGAPSRLIDADRPTELSPRMCGFLDIGR